MREQRRQAAEATVKHMAGITLRDDTLERMVRAVENVRERLLRSTAALRNAGIEYAVAGGNAVAAWVAQVDEGAVRNTRDVDILLRRGDLYRARIALQAAGFVYRHSAGVDLFLDSATASARQAVHIIFAGEVVRPQEPSANPDVRESEEGKDFRVLSLDALVRVKLTAFRKKDQVHLIDMIELGMIDASWCNRLPPELAQRLRELLDESEASPPGDHGNQNG
ncbi:MAG TPA: hypothetical protein VFC78_22270 [Tepidisphaeraceae bacterium]|nr:hypothetical protein [Tepidisphaeraceae bacterium]